VNRYAAHAAQHKNEAQRCTVTPSFKIGKQHPKPTATEALTCALPPSVIMMCPPILSDVGGEMIRKFRARFVT
jgi:hypothetical protein